MLKTRGCGGFGMTGWVDANWVRSSQTSAGPVDPTEDSTFELTGPLRYAAKDAA